MGCDIHWVLERRTPNGWLGVMSSGTTNFEAGSRWYAFFTELGLEYRGESETATPLRGFPPDASDLAVFLYTGWGADAHSPSCLPLADYVAGYARANRRFPYDKAPTDDRLTTWLFGGWFHSWEDSLHRVVFWFDN